MELIPADKVAGHEDSMFAASPCSFETANGDANSDQQNNLSMPTLKSKSPDCILENTPAVLCVGGRSR